jgi:transposase
VTVTGSLRRVLIRRSRGQKTPYRDKIRAQIVLLAAQQWSNTAIAAEVGVTVDTVRTWRGRFAVQGLAGLMDRARSGRPARFTAVQVAQAKALTCQLPARAGAPLSRWSCPELAREAVAQGIAAAISASTVWRWLAREAIKPWQFRSWLFPRDPDFAAKAGRVLDLYERRWEGKKLGPREYVISSDEKTSIQARVPLPSQPDSWSGADDAGQPRVSAGWRGGVSGRLRRGPCSGVRAVRALDRDRAVHGVGRAGHDV